MEQIINYSVKSKVQKEYYSYMLTLFIAVVIKYLLFLFLQLIDYFAELYYCDTNSEEYMFYGLRFLFFDFSLIFQIMVVLTSVIFLFTFNIETFDKENEEYTVYTRLYYAVTFIKIFTTFYILWTVVLLATFIPRIIIFILYKQKFSTFITVLFSLKMFIMTLFYIEVMIIYILYKDTVEEDKEKMKHSENILLDDD